MYVTYGGGEGNLEMLGLSPQDNNSQIETYKQTYGVTNPCAGTEGGGPEAIDIVITGQNFIGYPTYCIVCPDRYMYFDACWPPTAACFDPLIESCADVLWANFDADQNPGCAGETVSFTDQSTGDPTSWNWTFEGGDPPTSTEQNPSVVFAGEGDYDVTLEISDGSDTYLREEPDWMMVNPLPDVTLEPFDTTCLNYAPFPLSGGDPPGGDYMGPGITGNTFDPAAAGLGTHTISYVYNDGTCDNYAEQDIMVDVCTGLSEQLKDNFSIYPNPSTGNFKLEISLIGKVSIAVYDRIGKVVYENEIMARGSEQLQLNLDGNVNGLYFVVITTEKQRLVEKIRIVN